MIPPVSLPLNGGTVSACAGAPASIPPIATRHTAPNLRIADSISSEAHHNVRQPPWKEWLRQEVELPVRCCRVALDLVGASRHRSHVSLPADSHAQPVHFLESIRSCSGGARPADLRPCRPGRQSVRTEFLAVRPALRRPRSRVRGG